MNSAELRASCASFRHQAAPEKKPKREGFRRLARKSRPPRRSKRAVGFSLLLFLVEVAGLELAASSTRNWRATTCATPRFARCLRLWYYSTLHGVCQGFLGTKTWEFMKSEVFPIIPSPPRQDRRPPPRRSPPPGRSGTPPVTASPPRQGWRGNRTPPARREFQCDPKGRCCSPRP